MTKTQFKRTIWKHYRKFGRDLPWRASRDPYAVLVSEIMLQQTQVDRVVGYYERFLKQFPDFRSLAKAKQADVLHLWQGLGYNRRALMLKRLAEIVVRDHAGRLPQDRTVLESLPGIGKGTSGALRAFAFNKPEAFIETNIRRVFIHFFFPKKRAVTDKTLARYIQSSIDTRRPREWYWALMDYGAMLGKTSLKNPNKRSAHYKTQSRFAGSDREIRGKILRLTLSGGNTAVASLVRKVGVPRERIMKITEGLVREGFLKKKGNYIFVK